MSKCEINVKTKTSYKFFFRFDCLQVNQKMVQSVWCLILFCAFHISLGSEFGRQGSCAGFGGMTLWLVYVDFAVRLIEKLIVKAVVPLGWYPV